MHALKHNGGNGDLEITTAYLYKFKLRPKFRDVAPHIPLSSSENGLVATSPLRLVSFRPFARLVTQRALHVYFISPGMAVLEMSS